MNKDKLSFADVEQLLTELARHDQLAACAQDEAQTELMRGAACREIRRVFFRRRCLRLAGSTAMLAGLALACVHLMPETGMETSLATVPVPKPFSYADNSRSVVKPESEAIPQVVPAPRQPTYEGGTEGCQIVIYSVPL